MNYTWKYFLSGAAAVFLLSPCGRTLQIFSREFLGTAGVYYFFVALIFMAAVFSFICGRERLRSLPSAAGFAVFLIILLFITYSRRANPEEAFHLWEYGLLSLLAVRAIGGAEPDIAAHAAAVWLTAAVGALEELFQWALPNRFFDFRDIWLNAFAALLFQGASALMHCRGGFLRHAAPRSLKIMLRSAVFAAAVGLFITMLTPRNVAELVRRFPPLAFLASEHVIDFGFYHQLENGISFRSHFSKEQLHFLDRTRGSEVSQLLQSERPENREAFLAEHSEIRDPFVNEAEVHLFRRNLYFDRWRHSSNDTEAAETVRGEQQILDGCFRQSSSHLPLEEEIRERLKLYVRQAAYESPVEKDLITEITKNEIRTMLSLVLVALIALQFGLKRKKGQPPEVQKNL